MSDLEIDSEKERNIESSLDEIQKREENNEVKEAEKQENQISGRMESKSQSEEVKCCDEERGSLIFSNTNNVLSSGVIPLEQEPIDFVFGEAFIFQEKNELWWQKQLKTVWFQVESQSNHDK